MVRFQTEEVNKIILSPDGKQENCELRDDLCRLFEAECEFDDWDPSRRWAEIHEVTLQYRNGTAKMTTYSTRSLKGLVILHFANNETRIMAPGDVA